MDDFDFLTPENILTIHATQIDLFGGMHGIRDLKLLESAIGAPKVTFAGSCLYKTVYEMATAYMFHIIKNHPFIDGNKRTGIAAGLVFLRMNGYQIKLTEKQLFDIGIKIAESAIDIKKFAKVLKEHTTKF